MSSIKYWEKRALERLIASEKNSKKYINKVLKIYNQANNDINKQINNVYINYSKDTGLDIQKLKELLTKKDTSKFWKTLEGKGLKKYVKSNYKSRISRLEQLQGEIYSRVKDIAPLEVLENKKLYSETFKNTYQKTIKDISPNYDFSFSTFDTTAVNRILSEKWSGSNYSPRIWGNTDILADKLSNILSRSFITGQSREKTSQEIKEAFKVSKYYATRLIQTETNYYNNQAAYEAYKEMDIKEYVFMAVLDNRTSLICQELNGKKFKMSDMSVGENYPPIHPNCRSTVRAYIGKDYEPVKYTNSKENGKMDVVEDMKKEQFDIIQKNNPMLDDYHTGIRNIEDIKTFEEALKDIDNLVYSPDYTEEMAKQALKKGEITVYSSYPIKNGVFVTTSKMEASQYAGGNPDKVFSKTVKLEEIAWIDNYEGQYAKIEKD